MRKKEYMYSTVTKSILWYSSTCKHKLGAKQYLKPVNNIKLTVHYLPQIVFYIDKVIKLTITILKWVFI